MRLIWGNGVELVAVDRTGTRDTEQMVGRLANKYPHLDIKHLPGQTSLVADRQGNPVNLSNTPLATAGMEWLCKDPKDIGMDDQVDLKFTRPFKNTFIPPQRAEPVSKPSDQINEALLNGKFPPIPLMQSDNSIKPYVNNMTAKIGTDQQQYATLISKFAESNNPLLKEMGQQLQTYERRHIEYKFVSRDPKKAELMSRKWWATLCMATELKEGLEGKPVRKEIFNKEFLKEAIPRSMEGMFSKTADYVDKINKEINLRRIPTIDGSEAPNATANKNAEEEVSHGTRLAFK